MNTGAFPEYRPRRLRSSPALRALVRENELNARQLILPLFVRGGKRIRQPIGSMPGCFQLSIDEFLKECTDAKNAGVSAVLLFGIPESKDDKASGAYAQ